MAVPTFRTTQARMAVFPLITVTFVGVDVSMTGANVVDSPDPDPDGSEKLSNFRDENHSCSGKAACWSESAPTASAS